jgi:hypothetical protein
LTPLLHQYIFNDTRHDTEKTRFAIKYCRKHLKPYIFDKSIYYFNILSLIPKNIYIIVLKLLNKYTKIKKIVENANIESNIINDDYT